MVFNRGRGRSASLEQHANNVERILASIGVDPVQARISTRDGYGWTFQHGSALIEIYIEVHDQREYFQVVAPIIHLPMNNLLALYRRLLELNMSLTNAAIGVYQDVVYIFNERPLAGLDANEANFIISQIAGYADDLDNQFVNEFGGRLYTQT